MKRIILKIEGMKCGMCETHVNDVIRKVDGVVKVKSSHAKGQAIVIVQDLSCLDKIIEAVIHQGYIYSGYKAEEYQKKGLLSILGIKRNQ